MWAWHNKRFEDLEHIAMPTNISLMINPQWSKNEFNNQLQILEKQGMTSCVDDVNKPYYMDFVFYTTCIYSLGSRVGNSNIYYSNEHKTYKMSLWNPPEQ